MGIVSLTESPKRNIKTVCSTEYVQSFLIRCNGEDPVVGDGDLVGITPQVFNGIAKTMEEKVEFTFAI